ncbi:unnamed protein product [Tuber melanosporum]|jgi:hypothetical protein|uniref:(Perigord truffle) hypothetical protein n=1 Tax=Tuber melanosporum (strain Mel28) TaxID=656061 RepID=D5GG48_TUBMM|nr:uncharacterized protein GSTUM_00007178001 [Tuber melanosporum]CAZ83491.1 unnamed protein product [Tuber melanosporum]
MTTPQPAASSEEEAPFGYTKGGRPRKRPLSDANREGLCPVKECQRSFRHRYGFTLISFLDGNPNIIDSQNPQQALWQHLGYYLSPLHAYFPTSQAHIEMHEKMKAESASRRLTENEKKERQKESKKKWVEKNKEKRALSLKKSNLRKKAKKELKKEGQDLTERAIEELVEKWLVQGGGQ